PMPRATWLRRSDCCRPRSRAPAAPSGESVPPTTLQARPAVETSRVLRRLSRARTRAARGPPSKQLDVAHGQRPVVTSWHGGGVPAAPDQCRSLSGQRDEIVTDPTVENEDVVGVGDPEDFLDQRAPRASVVPRNQEIVDRRFEGGAAAA